MENDLRSKVVAAIMAFTCSTLSEAEAAADAILIIFNDPPEGPEGACPDCNGAGEVYRYSSQDPASSVERCPSCDGTGEKK